MTKTTTDLRHPGERGSALLIVLGFLSFMMISAVAFAVYMRIERQASSNYRHAASARHLLDSALGRAIDEVDSELRATNLKFPGNTVWPGRVFSSTIANNEDYIGSPRVLTLEALSYIPGILLNDVRYYAVPGAGGGAEWRTLSMPFKNMEGAFSANEAMVGRYAYVCVNLSDMLNVNLCKATARDSNTNRISIGHLFKDDADQKKFDARVKEDVSYTTLADFYACMSEEYIYNKQAPANVPLYSPWHEYLGTGNDFDLFNNASKHILVTDGIVKAEPTEAAAFNILNPAAPPIADVEAAAPVCNPGFITAFKNAFAAAGGVTPQYLDSVLNSALADYLDSDGGKSIPKRLDVPTVEMTPLISEISVPLGIPLMIEYVAHPILTKGNNPLMMSRLVLAQLRPVIPVDVEIVYPFKYSSFRPRSDVFKLKVQGYLKIHYDVNAAVNVGSSYQTLPVGQDNNGMYVLKLTGEVDCNDVFPDADPDLDKYVSKKTVSLNVEVITPDKLPVIDLIDEDGKGYNGFANGQAISFSLVLAYAGIRNGNEYVDVVPYGKLPPKQGVPDEQVFLMTPQKLYFKGADKIQTLGPKVTRALSPVNFKWTCLETPDPRFNWKADNWFNNGNVKVDGKLNQSTRDLLGQDGRDADIFMSVANTGKMQSPGELGFIVRPFDWNALGNFTLDLDAYTYDIFKQQCADYPAMFRTVRLYDHGAQGRDKIYENFVTVAKNDPLRGWRVNPLSDIPLVLEAAIDRVPLDYWVASEIQKVLEKEPFDPAAIQPFADKNFTKWVSPSGPLSPKDSWALFMKGWVGCMKSAQTYNQSQIYTDRNFHLRDAYGLNANGWYSADTNRRNIFSMAAGQSCNPLHEVDRKMLYSFSLESFSDRQQLFLYIVSAETTAASFGTSARSLAGGKAIAVVWRDPYPQENNAGVVNAQGFHEQKILYFKHLNN